MCDFNYICPKDCLSCRLWINYINFSDDIHDSSKLWRLIKCVSPLDGILMEMMVDIDEM